MQTTKNKEGFAQGHGDSNLTPEGIIQTKRTRDFLKNKHIDAIFCSSLGRAVKTATIIATPHNLTPIPKDDLREINWGGWSTLPVKNLLKNGNNFMNVKNQKEFQKRLSDHQKGRIVMTMQKE